ncbi:MAG: D-alanyl-D-alanine carboxypeptidase [Tepidibacter sp.]|jgi:D-alanyl-D-alanine carboxypeptidase (penicillin-binding protein 5/6)|uniref:D-alanyl-D-alanine carboxypeptidase family protein n=1 Tax=Tepidibacter sp. TaxID=2529387 RepID=UPI0025ED7172|nr:D-alanyl-D-alanine carboxypeptidase family protein [Tepidibacter sp.]MCT4509747.1 D-alanyl-D-alanine carboxypeptidase [Tepidibacter sp.]
MKKKLSLVLTMIMIISSFTSFANEDMKLSSKSAILIDANSGTILYEKNSHEKLPPASVTKIMSMLLTMEALSEGRIKLDDKVTISEKASSMGGSQLFLEPGEVKTVDELIKGIAVASANDGCVAMAEHIYGSEEAFVKKMNEKAQELGMKDTHFANTNGLPVEDHYTSAYDISLMSKELIKHKDIHKYLKIWMDEIIVGKKQKKIGLVNTNKLIRFYKGANGIKTGFTNEAKFCLSASATRNDLTLIAVVLGAPSSKERFNEASSLLNYGFANYETVKIYDQGQAVKKIKLEKADPENIELTCEKPLYYLNKKGDKKDFSKKIVIDENFKFPIKKGQKIGEVQIYKDKKVVMKSNLVSNKDIKKAGYIKMLNKVLNSIFN